MDGALGHANPQSLVHIGNVHIGNLFDGATYHS
jgi:hypothetical protein